MLTLDPAWIAAFAQQSPPIVVRVDIEVSATVTLTAVQGYSTTINAPASVASVENVASSMDVIDRRLSPSRAVVTYLSDGLARGWLVDYRLVGKALTITLGTRDLAAAAFAPVFKGLIEKAECQNDGTVKVTCIDAVGVLMRTTTHGWWVNMHPAEICANLIARAKVPASLYDATSYGWQQAQYATIRHWCVLRGGQNATADIDTTITEPVPISKLMEELAVLMNGSHVVDESGRLSFKRFDSGAAVVQAWTEADFDPSRFKVVEVDGNAINAVAVSFHRGPSGDESARQILYALNDEAIAAFAAYGETGRDFSKKIETEWVLGVGKLVSPYSSTVPAVGDSMTVWGYNAAGMCGFHWPGYNYPRAPQPSEAQLDDTHTAILRAATADSADMGDELIEVDRCVVDTQQVSAPTHGNSGYGSGDGGTAYAWPAAGAYRVKTRGFGGTTPRTISNEERIQLYDVTIPWAMVNAVLARASYGMPVIKFPTSLAFHHIQLGDFVTVATNRFAAYGDDGLDSASVFEVTGKEVSLNGDLKGITWTLTRAYKTSPPTYSPRPGAIGAIGNGGLLRGVAAAMDSFAVHIALITGGVVSAGTGLSVNIAKADVQVGLVAKRLPACAMTMPGLKDVYICFDASSSAWCYIAVDNNAAEPTYNRWQTKHAKVITNGAGVVAVEMMTNDKPFADNVVRVDNITPGAVSGPKLAPEAVTADKIGSGAVTTQKIDTAAIAPIHVAPADSLGASLTRNPYFTKRSRG